MANKEMNDTVSKRLEKANQILQGQRVRSLSDRDARIVLGVLDSEEEPTPALLEAAAWYKENHNSMAD